VPAEPDAIELAVDLVDAAEDKKAADPLLLEVADVLAVVDVFLLVTGTSDRQLKAVAESIEERARRHGRKPQQREGRAESGWMLLDFGDVVVHLFSPEQRDFYSLERLWADVPRIDRRTGARLPAVAGVPSVDEA
jgi:ribosome-associated protein